MIINSTQFNVDLCDILDELRKQLNLNGFRYLEKGWKRSGNSLQIQCPYHGGGKERKPSAGVRLSDGMFHCFACGEIHPLPEVISHCFGREDLGVFGFQWLLKNFATVQVEERKDVDIDFRRIGVRIGNEYDNVRQYSQESKSNKYIIGNFNRYVSEEELERYRYIHPYMYKRGLTNEIIELFDIGYDRNTDCITFPVRDIDGNCLFVARRSVKTKFFNYPEGVQKPLYGLYELYKQGFENFAFVGDNLIGSIIVCESMLDALSFWTIGKYAVAMNGLGDEYQYQQLRELPCRKLILATDMDDQGMRARERIRMNMQNTKIITEYIFPKGRKDANACTKDELENLEDIF